MIKFKINGGNKGKKCAEKIDMAYNNFLRCGIKNIENCCNKKREQIEKEFKSNKKNTILKYVGPDSKTDPENLSSFAKEVGLKFELNLCPSNIYVYIKDNDDIKATDPRFKWDAFLVVDDKYQNWDYNVHLYNFDDNFISRLNPKFIDSYGNLQDLDIEKITYHELLHIFGDYKLDGTLRHCTIGISCVVECLKRSYT